MEAAINDNVLKNLVASIINLLKGLFMVTIYKENYDENI